MACKASLSPASNCFHSRVTSARESAGWLRYLLEQVWHLPYQRVTSAQIAGGDRPLAEIAAEAGFADQSHFTRLFRRYLGTTPGRFRAFQSR